MTVDEKKSYTEFIKNKISPKKSINLSEKIDSLTTSQIKSQIIESTNALKQLMSTKNSSKELPAPAAQGLTATSTSTTEATSHKSLNVSSSSSPSSSSSEPNVPPKLPTSPPPLFATGANNNNECQHDSSDDEVKDYLALKDHNSYDEISHV